MRRPTNLIVSRMPPRQSILFFGLIAEEVAEVNPDLVGAQSRRTIGISSLGADQRDVAQ